MNRNEICDLCLILIFADNAHQVKGEPWSVPTRLPTNKNVKGHIWLQEGHLNEVQYNLKYIFYVTLNLMLSLVVLSTFLIELPQ